MDNEESKSNGYESEYSMMLDKINCGKKEMDNLLESTYKQYPFLEDKKQAIYMLAREKRLQFVYDNAGKNPSLEDIDDELDVDLNQFLD